MLTLNNYYQLDNQILQCIKIYEKGGWFILCNSDYEPLPRKTRIDGKTDYNIRIIQNRINELKEIRK